MKLGHAIADLLLVSSAYMLAVVLRVGGRLEFAYPDLAAVFAVVAALLHVAGNAAAGVYRSDWSLDRPRALLALAAPAAVAALALAIANLPLEEHPIPYAAIPTGAALAFAVETAWRLRHRARALARALFGRPDLAVPEPLTVAEGIPDVRRTLIRADATLRAAIEAIERDVSHIALVVDAEERLIGALTDGDVRRAVVSGHALDGPVAAAMSRHPVAARSGASDDDLLALMRRHAVRQMPIVDDDGHVRDIKLLDNLLSEAVEPSPVLIMAGGLGTRLGTMTRDIPKPLVRVGGRPILEILVRDLAQQGFRRIVLAVGYKADLIEQHFGDGARFGVAISYAREEQPLGTAGAIALVSPELAGPLVVANADLLTRVNFRALLEFHRGERNDLTIGIIESTYHFRYGLIETEGTRVKAITEKPTLRHFVNAGIYVLERSAAALVPPGRRTDMDALITASLERRLRVGCFPIHEYWADVGEPADLRRAAAEYPAR